MFARKKQFFALLFAYSTIRCIFPLNIAQTMEKLEFQKEIYILLANMG
jgi:hypothetical protein